MSALSRHYPRKLNNGNHCCGVCTFYCIAIKENTITQQILEKHYNSLAVTVPLNKSTVSDHQKKTKKEFVERGGFGKHYLATPNAP